MQASIVGVHILQHLIEFNTLTFSMCQLPHDGWHFTHKDDLLKKEMESRATHQANGKDEWHPEHGTL